MKVLEAQVHNERKLRLEAQDQMEGLRYEIRVIEGRDMSSDLWKEKCKEMFAICKELQAENEALQKAHQEDGAAKVSK